MEEAAGVGCQCEEYDNFKGNLDHYLKDNRGFKKVMLTLFLLEPFSLSGILITNGSR